MILTPEIERLIVDAIKENPDSPILLPEFCYWKGRNQPVVYIDSIPESLSRVLYRKLIGPLDYSQHLLLNEGVPERNVNPFLFSVETRVKRGHVCPNGHPYKDGNEMPENRGRWRCKICYRNWVLRGRSEDGGINVGDLNREKTHCPNGHPYDADNTQKVDGKRRCATCHREQMAAYRAARRERAAKLAEEQDSYV